MQYVEVVYIGIEERSHRTGFAGSIRMRLSDVPWLAGKPGTMILAIRVVE